VQDNDFSFKFKLFFKEGVFDEYDWAGTVSLVVFAMFETILFSWIFWNEQRMA
jgi:hypothetical protein